MDQKIQNCEVATQACGFSGAGEHCSAEGKSFRRQHRRKKGKKRKEKRKKVKREKEKRKKGKEKAATIYLKNI